MRTSAARTYTASIALSKAQLEHFYAGAVKDVQVREHGGLKLRFPLSALRPYVNHQGISGVFQIQVDAANRLVGVRKVA